mmetsp:Transcript_19648/g.45708  ORF Transcript_19648/g.45708 Transcript_19648/m.45708 type:complete len:200 (-) Transcript_19648:340-939(-)
MTCRVDDVVRVLLRQLNVHPHVQGSFADADFTFKTIWVEVAALQNSLSEVIIIILHVIVHDLELQVIPGFIAKQLFLFVPVGIQFLENDASFPRGVLLVRYADDAVWIGFPTTQETPIGSPQALGSLDSDEASRVSDRHLNHLANDLQPDGCHLAVFAERINELKIIVHPSWINLVERKLQSAQKIIRPDRVIVKNLEL